MPLNGGAISFKNGPIFDLRAAPMKTTFTFFIVLLCSALHAQLQKVTGNVSGLQNPANVRIILEYWNEDGWKFLGNVPLDAQGMFAFDKVSDHRGEYRLRLNTDPKHWADFLVLPKKNVPLSLSLSLAAADFACKPVLASPSREDSAYVQLMTPYFAYLYGDDKGASDALTKAKREAELSETAVIVQQRYKGTFAADVLCGILGKPVSPELKSSTANIDSVEAFNAMHALERVPFGNAEILHHIAFIRALNEYFVWFKEHLSYTLFIDRVIMKAYADDHVFAFTFRYLLDKMLDAKNEEGLAYLLNNYAQDCTDNNSIGESTKNLIKALENCKPGNPFKPLTLPDVNGKRIPMTKVFSENKITLVMFWRSNCSHCKEFEPILKDVYARYRSRGVEVYAVGTDKEETPWKELVTQQQAPWPSVYLSYDARTDFNKTYPVPSTPTLIAVDSTGKILRRVVLRSQIEVALDEMLREVEQKK